MLLRQTWFTRTHQTIAWLMVMLLTASAANAQDKKIDIDIGVSREPVWYQQPWAWVLGAAIFILLLVAVLRGTKKR